MNSNHLPGVAAGLPSLLTDEMVILRSGVNHAARIHECDGHAPATLASQIVSFMSGYI